jgi:oxygen-independent coproporphyrinogen-3 oxidase
MLNALRLVDGVPLSDFGARTGLPPQSIAANVAAGRHKGWLENHPDHLKTTPLGQRFLNDVIASFLD